MARIGSKSPSSVGTGKGPGGNAMSIGEVVLKGDAKQLDDTLEKSGKALDDVAQKVAVLAGAEAKASTAAERYRALRDRANESTTKAAGASANLTKAYSRLGFAAHQVVDGTASFARALQGVFSAAGPLGMAIGVVVSTVWHLVDAELAAADATKKATIELEKQRKEAEKQSKIDFFEKVHQPKQRRAAEERTAIASLRETEDFLEEEAALARQSVRLAKKGADEKAAKEQLAEVMAARAKARVAVLEAEGEIARAVGDMDESVRAGLEAEKVVRSERIRLIDDVDKADEKAHKKKKARTEDAATHEYRLALEQADALTKVYADMDARIAGYAKRDREAREAADWAELDRRFEAAADRSEQMAEARRNAELERERSRGAAQSIRDPRAAELEQERIEEEFRFQSELEIAFGAAEQNRQLRHIRELQRIDEERAARERMLVLIDKGAKMAASVASQTMVSLLAVSDARKQAERAAKAQGKTEAEAAQAGKIAELNARASQLQGIRNMAGVKAIEQTALGLGALASFNYPGAALHFAAAATFGAVAGVAGVRSNTLSDQAAGMEAGGGGFGGGGFGSTGGGGRGSGFGSTGGSSGPTPNTGAVPGSPTPQPRSGTAPGGGTQVINVNGPVYGTVDRDFARGVFERGRELGYTGRDK